MYRTILSLTLLLSGHHLYAHEGHDKTPGVVSAPHGGVVQGTNHHYFELVTEKDEVRIYPFDHDMKSVDVSTLKLEGRITLPRKKTSESVLFVSKADHFSAQIKSKPSHRYDLELSITQNGKTEKLKFTVEVQ